MTITICWNPYVWVSISVQSVAELSLWEKLMTQSEKIVVVSKILKKRFKLSNKKAMFVAWIILNSIDEPVTLVEVKPNGPTS
jgi:hypothetical protein